MTWRSVNWGLYGKFARSCSETLKGVFRNGDGYILAWLHLPQGAIQARAITGWSTSSSGSWPGFSRTSGVQWVSLRCSAAVKTQSVCVWMLDTTHPLSYVSLTTQATGGKASAHSMFADRTRMPAYRAAYGCTQCRKITNWELKVIFDRWESFFGGRGLLFFKCAVLIAHALTLTKN